MLSLLILALTKLILKTALAIFLYALLRAILLGKPIIGKTDKENTKPTIKWDLKNIPPLLPDDSIVEVKVTSNQDNIYSSIIDHGYYRFYYEKIKEKETVEICKNESKVMTYFIEDNEVTLIHLHDIFQPQTNPFLDAKQFNILNDLLLRIRSKLP